MSALRDAMSHAALGWVKPELDETLRQVRNEVEYYVEDPADDSRMRFCAGYLHQVQGTLRMVELYAPAMVAEELELLANAVRDGRVPDRDEACATLMRGTVLLPDYLERLQNGHRDIPIVLLPLLNEIRAARGEEGINESVLLAFDPDAVNASEAELDHARGSLSGRNRELLDTVGSAVKEELLRIKDALDLHMRTGSESSQLQTQVNELTAVADTLGVLGLGIARGVVVQQRDALREVVSGEQAVDETLLLDIAGALLYVDASLDDQVAHLGANIDGAGDASSLETRRTVEVLAHEAIANFAAAREAFVAFIETNWDHQRLVEVPRLLDEVAGALRMLDLQLPADYLSGVRQYIDTELLGRQRVPGGRQLDTLADAMASLEYYLEALRDRRPGREDILDITRSSLETLRYWPLPQRVPEQNADGPTVAEVSTPETSAGVQEQDAVIAEAAPTGTASAPTGTVASAAGTADAVEPGSAPRPYTLVFEKALEPFVPAPIAGLEVRSSLAMDSDPVNTSGDSQGFDPVFAEEGLVADDSYHIAPLDLSGDGSGSEEDVGFAGVALSAESADVSADWPVASVAGEAVASATPRYGFDRSLLEDDGSGLPAALETPAAITAPADAAEIAFTVSDDPAAPVRPIDGSDRRLLDDGDIAAATTLESADADATAAGFAALLPDETAAVVDLEQGADPDPLPRHVAVPSLQLPEMPAALAAAADGVAAEPVDSPPAFPTVEEFDWAAATPPPLPDIASASPGREPAQFSAQQVEAAFAAHREDAEAAAFMAQLDAAAAAFDPQTTASAPATATAATLPVAGSAAVTELAGGFEDNGEDIDQDIREVFIEEFDEELVNLGNLLPIWRASPGNMDRLRPLRRVFHTLKGSGRLVGARILGEFAWKIEGMLNRVLDGSRPASPAVVSLVTQAYEVLPELNAALRGQGKISSDLLAMQAVADRVAAGDEAFYIVPALSPASTATATITATPTPVAEGTPAVVDSVLLEILEAEIASHLETMREWLSGAQPQPQPASEELLRAVHTMSGAFAMTDVPEITAVTVPAESFVKRSLAAAITPSDVGVDALSDTVAAIATTIVALRAPAPRIPSFAGLAARLQELVDALPEAKWPPVAEEELAEIEALTRDGTAGAGQDASGLATHIAAADLSLPPVVEDQAPIEPASVSGSGFEPEIEVGGPFEPADSVAAADLSLPRAAEEWTSLAATSLGELAFEPVIDVEQTPRPADPVVEADPSLPSMVEAPALLEADRASRFELEIETAETVSPADHIAEADHALPQAGSDQPLIEVAPRSGNQTGAESGTVTPAPVSEDVEVALADARGTASLQSLPASSLEATTAPTIDAVPVAVLDSHDTVEAEAENEVSITSLPEEQVVPAPLADQQSGPEAIAAQAVASFADGASASLVDGDRDDLVAAEDVLIEPPSFADSTQTDQGEAIAGQQETIEEAPAGSATLDAEVEVEASLLEAATAPVAAITAARETTGAAEAAAEPATPAPTGTTSEQEEPAATLAIDDGALDFRELDQDLVDIFVEEGQDLLDHCDGLISELRAAPDDREALAGLQRDLHTLKGGARMAGINAIGDLGHAIESLLEAVAAQRTELARADVQLLERGFDRLHQLLTRTGKHRAVVMPHDLIAAFDARTEGRDQAAATEQDLSEVTALEPSSIWAPAVAAVPVSASEPESVVMAAVAPPVSADFATPLSAPVAEEAASDDEGASRTQEQVRVRSDLLDRLVNHAGEVAIYRSRLEQQLGAFRGAMGELDRTNARLRDQLRRLDLETEAQIVARYRREQEQVDQTFDPLELDRFSTLQQLSRALNESAADLGGLQGVLDDLSRNYDSLLQQQSRVSSELQDGLMRARMVPFDGLVPRLRRVVRQAAQDTGKQVQLSLEGTHGELDRNVLDRMVAPLEHMLRNSVAHGLESPAQRLVAGKPEEGGIVLRLRREGSEIVLEVADDGAGLNRAAIRQRAEQRGLIAVDAQISDSELDELIFASGFSTSEQVSQLAGRGVGMDVVRNEVRQLGGSIDIDSVPGHGVTFTLRLPQTLAVTQAVFVQIGETTFAVPVASVSGIGRIARERFESDEGRYHYNGEEFALHDLGSLVGQAAAKAEGQAQIPLLLVRAGDLRVAVAIDQVLGNREIVVKPVGLQIASVPGIYGATITGDGNVVVILDVAPLVRRHLAQPQAPVLAPASTGQRQVPMVMVVDDSLTMRKVTGRVLERHNFEVVVARDGIEALERLEERVPDLMLLDIEMPRMDGYELATAMRADPRFKAVPIVMITSRSGDKHRQRAFEIGVQRYLGKPYQELDLMRNVYDLLGIARVRQ